MILIFLSSSSGGFRDVDLFLRIRLRPRNKQRHVRCASVCANVCANVKMYVFAFFHVSVFVIKGRNEICAIFLTPTPYYFSSFFKIKPLKVYRGDKGPGGLCEIQRDRGGRLRPYLP